jgi:peptidoglycan hydrolase CwlO-like protein
MEVQARKFYSQRNMYLCGFTLFLSLILNRTYVMILDVLRLEEEVKQLKGDPKAQKDSKLKDAGGAGEVGALKKELEAKDRDMENLKKQVENMQKEYNRMGDEVSGKQ